MSLKFKYWLFVGSMYITIGLLCFFAFQSQKIWFFLSEIILIASLPLAYILFQNFFRPLNFIKSGENAIQDKDYTIKFVPTGTKEMDVLIDVYNKMIDNIRQERTQMEAQHFFLQKLIESSSIGVILLNYDDEITQFNEKISRLFKLKEEDIGKPISEISDPIIQEISTWNNGRSEVIAVSGLQKYRCEMAQLIHKGFARKFILIQELSKEILIAEKQAYGQVIRMMAHEVNNSIGAINSLVQSVREIIAEEKLLPEVDDSLQIVYNRNQSLAQFMDNFASIVRLPAPRFEHTELNQIMKRVAKLMEATAIENEVKINLDLYLKPLPIEADSQQLEQALINMVKNSIEACESGGIVRMTTIAHPISFSVEDNGTGISEAIQQKLFTPFFSTKTQGQGIGLILIKEILTNHKATFSLKTEGGWTIFKVFFRIPN